MSNRDRNTNATNIYKGSDTEYQQLLSRIPPKFFSRTNFNAFQYYHDDHELDMVSKTVNDAVALIVDRCYRAFNSATTSFRHVLQTFNESQEAIQQLQSDVTEGQRILFTQNRNLKELFHQQLTHEQILAILGKIEILTKLPHHIASHLSRHQYYRAVILLLHALDMLNTAELRQINALQPVRDDLLTLKQDLQRILYVELKNLIFLSDSRLRQSVLDDSTPSNLNTKGGLQQGTSTSAYRKVNTPVLNQDPLFSNLGIQIGPNGRSLQTTPGAGTSSGGNQDSFRFVGSSRFIEHPYRPGFGYYLHVVGSDGLVDPFTKLPLGGVGDWRGGHLNGVNSVSNPFNYNESITKSSLVRRQRQRKNLYNLETLGNTHDDDVVASQTLEGLKGPSFPSFSDALTPLKSDVIYDSHPHTKAGVISTSETTAALQSYLATHGFMLGELQDEDLLEDDNPCVTPFLKLHDRAIDADEIDLETQSNVLNQGTGGTGAGTGTGTGTGTGAVIGVGSGGLRSTTNAQNGPKIVSDRDSRGSNAGNLTPLASGAGSPTYGVKSGLKKPVKPEMKTGGVFHARYKYRLLALENAPTYIADPLSHPEEYMSLLIETLHLLNYLPSVEQRLLKQTPDSIRQLVSREINALASQVLTLALQSYQQSSYAWRGPRGVVNMIGKMTNFGREHRHRSPHNHTGPHTTASLVNSTLRPNSCSSNFSHDPNNPFSSNIVQHKNIVSALLPWQNPAHSHNHNDLLSEPSIHDHPSRTTSRFSSTGSNPYGDSSDEDSLTRSGGGGGGGGGEDGDKKRAKRGGVSGDSARNLRSGSVYNQYYKDEKSGGGVSTAVVQATVKILQQDSNFQARMLSDLLVVVCKLCTRVLMSHKQTLAHIAGLKNINEWELDQTRMTIQSYHSIISEAFTRPDALISVHESTRKTYNAIQIQIQQMLWRFWDKTQLPMIFSIDDEITTKILTNSNYSQYKSNANTPTLLNGLSNMNPFAHTQKVFANIHNLTPQQFIQQLFIPISNSRRGSQDMGMGMGSPTSTGSGAAVAGALNGAMHTRTENQDKEAHLKFFFGNSRMPSVARQQAQSEFVPQDYEQEAKQRAAKLKEAKKKERGQLYQGEDDDWHADDDDDNDLLRSDQDDKSSWLMSNSHHISLVYLPILNFSDVCNAIVDGIENTPYLPPPPIYSLFPHMIKSNLAIARQYYQRGKRWNRWVVTRYQSPTGGFSTPTSFSNLGTPNQTMLNLHQNGQNGQNIPMLAPAQAPLITSLPAGSQPTPILLAQGQGQGMIKSTSTMMGQNSQNGQNGQNFPKNQSFQKHLNSPLSPHSRSSQPDEEVPLPETQPLLIDFLLPIVDLHTAIQRRLDTEEDQRAAKIAAQELKGKKREKEQKKSFSPYEILPAHVAHLIPRLKLATKTTVTTTIDSVKDALLLNKPSSVQSAAVSVQPRVLGSAMVNPFTRTSIWTRTNLFVPFPLPSIRSLLQNTSLNTSFLHSSYPLAQCLALAIQDVFLPRLHQDILHSIERLLNSPDAFKPFENTSSNPSLLGPATSINLAKYEDIPGSNPQLSHNFLPQNPALSSPVPSGASLDSAASVARRQSMTNVFGAQQGAQDCAGVNTPNQTRDQVEGSMALSSITAAEHSVQQLYRAAVYQQAAYETNEPFKRLYHFFANLYQGTLSSQLLLEQLLSDPDYAFHTAHSASQHNVATVGGFDGLAMRTASESGSRGGGERTNSSHTVLSHQRQQQQNSKQRQLSSAIGLSTGHIKENERQLPSTVTGLLKRVRTSPHFTGTKSITIINSAYDISLVLEALSQDMCLLPQFSHHIMALFQYAVDSFIERVQLKYMEVTQISTTSSLFSSGLGGMYEGPAPVAPGAQGAGKAANLTSKGGQDDLANAVYPTRILADRANIDAMASDLWFMDLRGIPRSNKQHTNLYSVVKDRLLKDNLPLFGSLYQRSSRGYYDTNFNTASAFGASSANVSGKNDPKAMQGGNGRGDEQNGQNGQNNGQNGQNNGQNGQNNAQNDQYPTSSNLALGASAASIPDPSKNSTVRSSNADGLVTTTTTTTVKGGAAGLEQRFLDPISEFYIDTFFSGHNPALSQLLSKDFSLSLSQLFHQTPMDLTTNTTMLKLQQNLTLNESTGLVSLLFGSSDKKKSKISDSEKQKTLESIAQFQSPAPGGPDQKSNGGQQETMGMACAVTSRASSAIKPLSYIALLSNSLDWLSNFLYHLSIPGNRPLTLAEAASTTMSTLPRDSKQKIIAMESNFSSPSSPSALEISPSGLATPREGELTESPSLLDFVSMQKTPVNNTLTMSFHQQLSLIPLYDPSSTGLGNILSAFTRQHQGIAMNSRGAATNQKLRSVNLPSVAGGNPRLTNPPPVSHLTIPAAKTQFRPTGGQQPLVMVPGHLQGGVYTPLLANIVPSCYQSSHISSAQAIYESIVQDMSGTGASVGITANLHGSAPQLSGFSNSNALSGDINMYNNNRPQVSALDHATRALNTYTSLVSVFIAPTYSSLFARNPFMTDSHADSGSVTTTTTTTGGTTTTTTTTTTRNGLGAGHMSPPQTGSPSTPNPGQLFDLSLGNGASSGYSMGDLLASSMGQPLLQYNPSDSYQSTLALSRCLALTKMLPDAVQVRMYVTEEAALRYLDEGKWRSYLVWNSSNPGPGSFNSMLSMSGATGGDYALSSHDQEIIHAKAAEKEEKEKSHSNESLLSQAVSSLTSTDAQLCEFYSLLSMKRFELSHKLYEFANVCMFTIKLEIICRVIYHLRSSTLSNYNIKPTLFTKDGAGTGSGVGTAKGSEFKLQLRKYQKQQRQQFLSVASNQAISQANKHAMNLLFQNIDTEQYILELNKDLCMVEESLSSFWDDSKIHYVFGGIPHLISSTIITNFSQMPVKLITPLGIKCVHRNLHSMSQTFTNSILPQHHNLSLLSSFPQFFHHHPQYNDLQFARVREYTSLMKCTVMSLPTQAQQRMFKFTDAEFATLIEIITSNAQEKTKHLNALKAQRQLLISSQQRQRLTSLQQQQDSQRNINKNIDMEQEQARLERIVWERDNADKMNRKNERDLKRLDAKRRQDEEDDKERLLNAAAANAAAASKKESSSESDSESDSDQEDKSKTKVNVLADLSRWTTVDKDVKVERKRGPAGQTTMTTTKTTVIKTGVGEGPQGSTTSTTVGAGGAVSNTTAALLNKGTPTQQHQIILNNVEASPTSSSSSQGSSRFGFFDRFRKK